MKIKKLIWIIFGTFLFTEIVFLTTPLRFNNEDYAFAINAITIILFSVFMIFTLKKLSHKIIFPLLTFIVLSGALIIHLISGVLCCDYDENQLSIDNYVIKQGMVGGWAGPATGSFDQLEKKVVGDIVTWIIERKEVKFSEIEFAGTPTLDCMLHFKKNQITIDICEKKILK